MDELLLLAFLFWIFKAIAKKGKGKTKQKKTAERARVERMAKEIQRARQAKQASVQPSEPISVQTAAPVMAEGESYMAFTQDAHGCVSEQEEYMGSLRADSSEGEDACDPALEHERKILPDPASVYAGEIGSEPVLDLSARGIYQGVVMSEILNRPVRRMRRRV